MTSKRIIVGVGLVAAIGVVFAYWTGLWPPKSGMEGTIGAAKRYQSGQISDKDVALQDQELQALLQSDVFHKLQTDPAYAEGFRVVVASKAFEEAAKKNNYVNLDKQVEAELAAKNSSIEGARVKLADSQKRAAELEKRRSVDKSVSQVEVEKARTEAEVAKKNLETLEKSSITAADANARPQAVDAGKRRADAENRVKVAEKRVVDTSNRVQELEKKSLVDKSVKPTDIANARTQLDLAKKNLVEAQKAEQNSKLQSPTAQYEKVQTVMKSEIFQKLVTEQGAALKTIAISGEGLGKLRQALDMYEKTNQTAEMQKTNQGTETEKRVR